MINLDSIVKDFSIRDQEKINSGYKDVKVNLSRSMKKWSLLTIITSIIRALMLGIIIISVASVQLVIDEKYKEIISYTTTIIGPLSVILEFIQNKFEWNEKVHIAKQTKMKLDIEALRFSNKNDKKYLGKSNELKTEKFMERINKILYFSVIIPTNDNTIFESGSKHFLDVEIRDLINYERSSYDDIKKVDFH